MNIILPYSYEALNGLELRYALRSIETYLTGYKKIYLIGDRFPSWIRGIDKIYCSEAAGKDVRNILKKVHEGLKVTKEAIQWQDDIYLTRPLDVSDIKYWHEGDLESAIFHHHGSYKTQIINTALQITEKALFYDVHTPILYKLTEFNKIFKYDWNRKFLVKSLYCYEAGVDPCPYKDSKIHGPQTEDILRDKMSSLFFSTSPQSISPALIKMFEDLYPKPSKYEV